MEYNENYADNTRETFSHYPDKLDSIDFLRCAQEIGGPEGESDIAARTFDWLRRNAGDDFIVQYEKRILGVTNWFNAMFGGRRKKSGLSRDDVFQTVCMVALKVKAECSDERWLPFLMKRQLQRYMWREIMELLPQGCGFEPQELLLRKPARETKRWLRMLEAEDMLERALAGKELLIAKLLLAGLTKAEIAGRLGVGKSMVSKYIASIREKLRPLFGEAEPDAPDDREVFPDIPESSSGTPDSIAE